MLISLYRMFSASLTDDVRMIAEDIDALSERIEDPVLCQKVEQYAMAPFEIQEIFRKDAGRSREVCSFCLHLVSRNIAAEADACASQRRS
jgi:pseudouridine-5'-phosphate glycosidase